MRDNEEYSSEYCRSDTIFQEAMQLFEELQNSKRRETISLQHNYAEITLENGLITNCKRIGRLAFDKSIGISRSRGKRERSTTDQAKFVSSDDTR
jgi:hypothetical protein